MRPMRSGDGLREGARSRGPLRLGVSQPVANLRQERLAQGLPDPRKVYVRVNRE